MRTIIFYNNCLHGGILGKKFYLCHRLEVHSAFVVAAICMMPMMYSSIHRSEHTLEFVPIKCGGSGYSFRSLQRCLDVPGSIGVSLKLTVS